MKINRELCDICGTCVAVCPADAIIVKEFIVTIDNGKCIDCLKCLKICPVNAIKEGE